MDEVFTDLSSGLKRIPAVAAGNMIVSKIKPCNRRVRYSPQSDEPWMLTLNGTIPKLKDLGVYSDLGVVVSCKGQEMVGYMTPSGQGETSNKWKIRCCPSEEVVQFIQRGQHDSKKQNTVIAQITVLDGLLPLKRAYVACHEIPEQFLSLPWFENTSLTLFIDISFPTEANVKCATNQYARVGCRSWRRVEHNLRL